MNWHGIWKKVQFSVLSKVKKHYGTFNVYRMMTVVTIIDRAQNKLNNLQNNIYL